ncbi:hypothetical protein EDB81DRAFT_803970 [Dactylonectria macrodidyma]|uniref:DNA mismatch repair protein PMS1 n=1 Tax=Dactylonectria macrodidyma TaxID=307937 RepID=A0A9P9ISC7_9HYPO|nr:hypothetical protein EDB81DRAFT_803970 [Dactylonectria macrodidyma]
MHACVMATIKKIDGRTVHQIQSGQVIVDLCSVVKELVENSIDAEATSIDIRFKNQGLDLIEIQDNGIGISPDNYPSVALKHHTSKLSSYSDIASLQTFGFRGEALASLCALSVLSVTTCQASEVPKGSNLTFEPSGKLKGTTVVAAQRGTTISVEKLFHNLPVRRRELERNIKREWHKVIALLNQYAIIQTNLKFSVSQQPTKGKRIHLFSTRGNHTTRDNIINIFGAKAMTVLVPLDLRLEMQPSTISHSLSASTSSTSVSRDVRVIGHVSRPAHGDGRQTPDRQMFFVNGRPCALPQFAKVFNEVYRSHNSSQSPFILADIQLDTDMYDVNVSPDKRSILLHDQNYLLDTLRDSLMALFDSHDHSVPTAQLLKPQRDTLSSKTTPITPKTIPRPTVLAESSDQDTTSENEEIETESSVSKIPQGRAMTMGKSRSLTKDGHGQNLISRWVESKAGNRIASKRKSPSPAPEAPTSRAGRKAIVSSTSTVGLDTPKGLSESSESDEDDKPRPVRDFNKRLAEFSTTRSKVTKKPAAPACPSADEDVDDEAQLVIPQSVGLAHLNRETENEGLPPSALRQNAPELTAIVVGDLTVTNMESSSPEPDTGDVPLREDIADEKRAKYHAKPTFGDRLTQLFSASEKDQVENTTHRILSDDEMEDNEGGAEQEEEKGSNGDEENDNSDDENEEEVAKWSNEKSNKDGQDVLQSSSRTKVETNSKHSTSKATPTIEDTIDDSSSSLTANSPGDKVKDFHQGKESSQVSEAPAEPSMIEQRDLTAKSGVRRKDATYQTVQHLRIDESTLRSRTASWAEYVPAQGLHTSNEGGVTDINADDAEEKLSLGISKGDFFRMRIAGQFNLGFIIAIRPAKPQTGDEIESIGDDELFIIDQHATDEKYNFERLQATTVVQSQRLVHPKRLELTALEEEVVMENMAAIEANGFKVDIDTSGNEPVGSRCKLLALPLSRETTFTLADLEELISLLGDESSESKHIPRPSKVRKMFAMRACRSSIMIGKPLTQAQMETLVRHMGELDKPWNCPHGRPTMRHLCKLQHWDENGWKGDRGPDAAMTWRSFARGE